MADEDPTAATRARLDAAHASYLERPPTDSRRLAVEAILGVIGDLADEAAVAGMLGYARLDVSPERLRALSRRVARQVRGCTVTITWPDDPAAVRSDPGKPR
jgi:hypothetical protein